MATTISVIAAFVILSFFHVVMGEIVPKSFTLQHAERVSLIVAGPINWFYALFRPFIWVLVKASGAVLRWVGVSAPTVRPRRLRSGLLGQGAGRDLGLRR